MLNGAEVPAGTVVIVAEVTFYPPNFVAGSTYYYKLVQVDGEKETSNYIVLPQREVKKAVRKLPVHI